MAGLILQRNVGPGRRRRGCDAGGADKAAARAERIRANGAAVAKLIEAGAFPFDGNLL